jgi:glyoxylate reductase
MKVAVTFPIPEPAKTLLSDLFDCRFWESEVPIPSDTLAEWLSEVEGVLTTLTCPLDEASLSGASHLKVISTVSVGVDHIDVDFAKSQNIMIGHTPGVLTDSTADLAIGLMLAVGRRLAEGDALVREGAWSDGWKPNLLLGTDLSKSTVGLVGMGPIGQAVAKRLAGFGCRVIAWNRTHRDVPGVEFMDLNTLLSSADIVSLHTALTDETRELITRERLSLMKDQAILINTARGAIIDEVALVDELASGRLRAGLDVYNEEPLPADSVFHSLPGCVLLPHVGSATQRTRQAMFELALRNLVSGMRGETLPAAL